MKKPFDDNHVGSWVRLQLFLKKISWKVSWARAAWETPSECALNSYSVTLDLQDDMGPGLVLFVSNLITIQFILSII